MQLIIEKFYKKNFVSFADEYSINNSVHRPHFRLTISHEDIGRKGKRNIFVVHLGSACLSHLLISSLSNSGPGVLSSQKYSAPDSTFLSKSM